MKKCVVWILSLLLFTGCGASSNDLDTAMALRSRILQSSGCTFTAVITADYSDQLCRFTLDCSMDSTGAISFTVVEPESISGISGKLSENDGQIIFEDFVLHFPLMADDTLSPISSPWIFIKALRSGFLASAGTEKDETRISVDDYYEEEPLRLDIWLNKENVPACVDILHDGRRILTMNVIKFEIS